MIKIIVTFLLKLHLAFKALGSIFISFFEVIARFIDDIGYHVLHPIRTIRFQEVRDFLSDHAQPIVVISFMIIIIGILSYKNKEDKI